MSATGETDSSVWLSTEQLDALAADPSELLLDLQMIAGVGSIVRVDGVDGGTAPPKAAIAAIHITRIGIAGGEVLTVIDVMTKSG